MEQGKKLQRRLLLHEEVSQYIKETILTGELKPGDRIVESRLAQELGFLRLRSGRRCGNWNSVAW